MKKYFLMFVVGLLTILCGVVNVNIDKVFASTNSENLLATNCKAYVLLDKDSKKVLAQNNSKDQMPVASIVKLMTILLTLEEIADGNLSVDEMVPVSENASGMGGSQIFLDANVEYKLGELLKSVIVCSANDSSVALAEHISGNEQLFVKKMNEKAKTLNLNNTNYENATGLPSPNQYSCAYDVGILLSEVLNFDLYHEYSKIWLEDFVHPSGRTTEMTNTNKLSRFYDGCIGGKTGSTNEAKFCLSVGAKRENMSLVAVVLGNETSKERFDNARSLLNYGFANFENKILFDDSNLSDVKLKIKWRDAFANLKAEKSSNIVFNKGENIDVKLNYYLPNTISSVDKGEIVGYVDVIINGEKYESVNIMSDDTFNEPSYLDYLKHIQEDFT